MTLSITVLVMEGTGALQLVVPMMLAVFMAKIVGDAVGMGVYDLHIKIRGAPVLVSLWTKSHCLLCSPSCVAATCSSGPSFNVYSKRPCL